MKAKQTKGNWKQLEAMSFKLQALAEIFLKYCSLNIKRSYDIYRSRTDSGKSRMNTWKWAIVCFGYTKFTVSNELI